MKEKERIKRLIGRKTRRAKSKSTDKLQEAEKEEEVQFEEDIEQQVEKLEEEEELFKESENKEVKLEFEELEHLQNKHHVPVQEEDKEEDQQDDASSPRRRRDGWEKYPWMCTDCSQVCDPLYLCVYC